MKAHLKMHVGGLRNSNVTWLERRRNTWRKAAGFMFLSLACEWPQKRRASNFAWSALASLHLWELFAFSLLFLRFFG
jgi:hypothetical protein